MVNSRRRTETRGGKAGILWVERVGDRRSQAILARDFSLENGGPAEKGKNVRIEKPRQSGSACSTVQWEHGVPRRKEEKNKNRNAHSGVQSSDERAGRGSIRRPFPPRPLAWLTLCHCDVLLGHQHQKAAAD